MKSLSEMLLHNKRFISIGKKKLFNISKWTTQKGKFKNKIELEKETLTRQ